ncbi:MAG TPA: HAMP domain-containing sensor histidine kinase [Candidatus Binataceae bacterium]|nr:HAMP domain-containing sensor histidine kinase [Candidatus Binataceae bacterium]
MAQVARRLLPNLERTAERWAESIQLSAPSDKIPRMRQTLRGMTVPFLHAFFERLAERDPKGALAAHERFIENVVRSQLDEPERQRATIEALFASAHAVRGLLVQEIGRSLEGDEGQIGALLPFNRLWSEAIESIGRVYVRLREDRLRHLYEDARRTAEKLRESEERFRLMAKEAREARDAALEASRIKSAFVANVTHEIHTPLNIILGYADLMAERLAEFGDDRARDYAEPVRRAGKRLLGTIASILEISRIEAGEYRLDPKPIALGEFIEGLLREFKILAAKKGLSLGAEIAEPGAVVTFDEVCLSNTLTNLLQNAIKFTERGAVTLRLWRGEDAALRLQVRDTGVGIDPRYLPHIFQAFSQENPGLTRKFEGVGLGLSLVRKYLELNGAAIAVASEKDKGATFTIRFAPEAVRSA